jgi:helix-turn-helix protein
MNTKEKTADFKLFHALMRQAGATPEEKKILINFYSDGKTTSLKELFKNHNDAYNDMIESLKVQISDMPKVNTSEGDVWRKRCIAAISAWLDINGNKPNDRMKYIKSVACRTVAKDDSYFNKLTIAQLRTIYNSFIKQRKALENANGINKLFTINHVN